MKKNLITTGFLFLLSLITNVFGVPTSTPHQGTSNKSWLANYLEEIANGLNIPVQLLEIILLITLIAIIIVLAILTYLLVGRIRRKKSEN